MKIVYSPNYNIDAMGLDQQHPFDVQKYGRAWSILAKEFGAQLDNYYVPVPKPVNEKALLKVHTEQYLKSLQSSGNIAEIIEIPAVSQIPAPLLDEAVLKPMRWACMGTVIAAQRTLTSGLAVNMGGGFHHASPSKGHGFCFYSDIALAIHVLRRTNALAPDDTIAYIDLDAHQGDGVCQFYMDDPAVQIFDMYNKDIFPNDRDARKRVNKAVPLPAGTTSEVYMKHLTEELPEFLKTIAATKFPIKLAIFNAGTDIYQGDGLGGLKVSEEDVLKRDLFVVGEFRKRQIPTLAVLSGGYSKESYRLIADSVVAMAKANHLSSHDAI